jgi:hypothetical protein
MNKEGTPAIASPFALLCIANLADVSRTITWERSKPAAKSIGTTITPLRIAPQNATTHQGEFGAQIISRSPELIPAEASQPAILRA